MSLYTIAVVLYIVYSCLFFATSENVSSSWFTTNHKFCSFREQCANPKIKRRRRSPAEGVPRSWFASHSSFYGWLCLGSSVVVHSGLRIYACAIATSRRLTSKPVRPLSVLRNAWLKRAEGSIANYTIDKHTGESNASLALVCGWALNAQLWTTCGIHPYGKK